MEQIGFEWTEQNEKRERVEPAEVALEPETTAVVITLMARLLVAVVCAAEEVTDER